MKSDGEKGALRETEKMRRTEPKRQRQRDTEKNIQRERERDTHTHRDRDRENTSGKWVTKAYTVTNKHDLQPERDRQTDRQTDVNECVHMQLRPTKSHR